MEFSCVPFIQNLNDCLSVFVLQPISQGTNVNVNMGNNITIGVMPKRPWSTNLCGCMQDIETCKFICFSYIVYHFRSNFKGNKCF